MAAVGAAGVMVGVSGVSQASAAQPSRQGLTRAVTQYLAQHGDLCVGKFTWPRIVTPEDREEGTDDAVQLPVLEHLGLVKSTRIPAPAPAAPVTGPPGTARSPGHPAAQSARPAAAGPVLSYSLTPKGQRYYLRKTHTTVGGHGQAILREADLCVGHLSLDKVIKWTAPEPLHGHLETLVRYTYHIKAAHWMASPQARRVFPIIAHIIAGQGSLPMSVTVQLRDGSWVPVLPGQ